MRLSSSLADSGVIGPVTRVYPDNGAHSVHALRRGGGYTCCFAALGTDLGTERGEFGANKRDVVKQAGRRNAVDLNI
jgi:hypothetical protein